MTKICKECGYLVIDSMGSCPNCGANVSDNDKDIKTITCPNCGADVDENEDYCPECGEPLYDDIPEDVSCSTEAPDVIPICTLKPLTLEGERRASVRTFEDDGNGVELRRDNTMPSEQSIDDELQAHLFFYNGEWYIEEGLEDARSTYVHAGKGIKLAPGDIIRMGDREFEFNIKTK